MAWRLVRQPDGRFARFAETVDDFTHMNLSRDAAIALAVHELGTADGATKVYAAEDVRAAGRWTDALEQIRIVHGPARVEQRHRDAQQRVPVYP